MSMTSFYGGRQGASFVIVKQFDGIDIPQESSSYVYRKKIYAIQTIGSEEYFIYPFIERNGSNYEDYSWGILELDGQVKNIIQDGATSTITVDAVLAEGMRQCFEKGGDSTNIVNYGEYVIIDTLFGLNEVNNPDNGKVYRRGINFDYSATDNPLAGGEYIGQIVGAMGLSPKLQMDTVQEVIDEGGTVKAYTPQEGESNSGIVPGRYLDDGVYKYNDNINYGWYSYYDVNGSRCNSLIGFTFPYLVEEFTATKRSPYYQDGDDIPTGKEVGDLLPADFSFIKRTDDGAHPFFQQWHVNLPHGIKGDSPSQVEVYATFVREGAIIYEDAELTIEYGIATGEEAVNTDLYDNANSYMELEDGHFASIEDGWKQRIRYKNYVYDETEDGEFTYIDIGKYNTVKKITLSPEGLITAYYTYDDPTLLNTSDDSQVRWIYYNSYSEEAQGVYITEDGTITVVYNTLDENEEHEKQVFEKALSWIHSITLDGDGKFKVIYNNDSEAIQDATGTETDISGVTRKVYETILSTVTNVRIDTDGSSLEESDNINREGDGSQQVEVEYNRSGEFHRIGRPLNYIIDSFVVPTSSSEIDLRGHLLVYFSDPVRRANSIIADKEFHSSVLDDNVKGWTDLGLVKGEKGGTCIFGTYSDISALGTDSPEVIMGSESSPDYNYAGWSALVGPIQEDYHLAVYDYVTQTWQDVGVFIKSSIEPNRFITTDPNDALLQVNGFVVDISTVRKTADRN